MAVEDGSQIPDWKSAGSADQCAVCRRERDEIVKESEHAAIDAGGFRIKIDGVSTEAHLCYRCIATLEELGAEVDYLYP